MDAEYVEEKAVISVTFQPEEIEDAIEVLKSFIIDAGERQMHIPLFADGFFEKLAKETTPVFIEFGFAHFEFGINFINRACVEIPNNDDDIVALGAKLDRIWAEVEPFCVSDSTLH